MGIILNLFKCLIKQIRMYPIDKIHLPQEIKNMPELDWFETWFDSPYYHQLYNHRDEEEALRFINNLLDKLQPTPGCRMLDLACGKGRHSKALWDRGYDVTGVDLSDNSISAAKEYECDTLRFYTHDMRFPLVSNYFDYTFNFFTSFGYFETEREHINALRTMSSSLKKDGILVIDFLNTSLPSLGITTSLKQKSGLPQNICLSRSKFTKAIRTSYSSASKKELPALTCRTLNIYSVMLILN